MHAPPIPDPEMKAPPATEGPLEIMTPAERERFDAELTNLSRQDATERSLRKPTITAPELMAKAFPEPRWAVPGLIPEGLTVFGGKSKMGKSWLLLGLGINVASGGRVLSSIQVEARDVLYLALEDSERRVKDRLGLLLAGSPPPPRLNIATRWDRLDQGGLEQLGEWLEIHPDAGLVIVDTWAKIKPPALKNSPQYDTDYAAVGPIQELANRRRVAIVAAHHITKLQRDDWVDALTGSVGLAAAADAVSVLYRDRGQADAILRLTGRDVEEIELALRFTEGMWSILGAAATYRLAPERIRIIKAIAAADRPLRLKEVAVLLEQPENRVRSLLRKMLNDGQVERQGHGQYVLPRNFMHNVHDPTLPMNGVNEENEVNTVNEVNADIRDDGMERAVALVETELGAVEVDFIPAKSQQGGTDGNTG